jgi:hypothetical protein
MNWSGDFTMACGVPPRDQRFSWVQGRSDRAPVRKRQAPTLSPHLNAESVKCQVAFCSDGVETQHATVFFITDDALPQPGVVLSNFHRLEFAEGSACLCLVKV